MPRPALNLRTWPELADAAGVVIVLTLAAWVAFFAGGGDGRVGPVLWLLAGIVTGVVVGRLTAEPADLVPRVVALAVTGSIVLTWPGALRTAGAPLGYANANAALAALGTLMALEAAGTSRSLRERNGWLVLGAALCAATASTGSVAAVVSLGVGLLLLGVAAVVRWPPAVIVGGVILVSLGLGLTSAIAVGGNPAGLGARTEIRGELWAAAAQLADENPVRGVGPGRFAELNPASDDADLRWAHHGYLQVAAELGIVGFALVLAVAGWVASRLWIASEHEPVRAALAGAAVLVVSIHALVDYVWHIPALLLVLSVVVGAATTTGGVLEEANAPRGQTVPIRGVLWAIWPIGPRRRGGIHSGGEHSDCTEYSAGGSGY